MYLLMNAIQHCEAGSIISVSIQREGNQVRVAVATPGKAIEPDILDHLFDRFYRVEVSRTNSRENHGLGLAIVKATAEMHGGQVFATSAGGINTFGFSVEASEIVDQPPSPSDVRVQESRGENTMQTVSAGQ